MKNTAVVCPSGWRRKASKERPLKLAVKIGIFPYPACFCAGMFSFSSISAAHRSAHAPVRESACRSGLHIDALGLYGGVHALCQGVVRRLVVLRHADGDTVFLKLSDVHVATVLHAAVGVVDEPLEVVLARLRYGHAERVQSEQGTERGGQPPAYYLARIGVGHQV